MASRGHWTLLHSTHAPCCFLHQDALAAENDVYFQSACCAELGMYRQMGGLPGWRLGEEEEDECGVSLEAPTRTSAAITQLPAPPPLPPCHLAVYLLFALSPPRRLREGSLW